MRTPATLEQIAEIGASQLIALRAWTQIGKGALPLSSGGPIPFQQWAQITVRPQQLGTFRPECLVILNGDDFLVSDLTIGNRSQFAQVANLRGSLFNNPEELAAFVSFEPVMPWMDVVIVVSYVGENPQGAPFHGVLIGDDEDAKTRHTLLWIDETTFVLEERRDVQRGTVQVEIVKVDGEDLDRLIAHLALSPLDPPRIIDLHLLDVEDRRILFGVDDTAGAVIFEAVADTSGLHATIDLDGYVPEWLAAR